MQKIRDVAKHKDPVGSFVRWQAIQIAQLTFAANLILGLAVSALGFQVTQIDKQLPITKLHLTSLIFLTGSVLLGVILVVNRTLDFRETAQTARRREEGNFTEAERHRARSLFHSKWTWKIFWGQTGAFAAGALCTVVLAIALAR